MLLPLAGAALAGTPPDWLAWPVTADLHPVGWNYGCRYQEVLTETMGGTRASPAFSPVVATADVHWKLVASTGTGLWLDETTPATWRDVALAGAVLSATRIVDETLDRAPTLNAFYTAIDTVVNPSIHVQRERDGDVTVVHRSGGRLRQDVDRAEEEIARPDRRRPPSVDLGLDWHLRDQDDPPRTPFLDYGAFLSLSEILVSNLRLEALALAGQWNVTGRQRVYPGVYVLATARSADTSTTPISAWTDRVAPARWSVGVLWNVPRAPDWNLRFERITTLADGSVTWQVVLRAELGAFAPGRVYPALGARDPYDAWLPDVPERAGLALTSVVASPTRVPTPAPSEGSEARRSPDRR